MSEAFNELLSRLERTLSYYRPDSLLSGLSGLQLIPQNAHRIEGLEMLQHIAASLPIGMGRESVKEGSLRDICELSHPLTADTPALAPFTEEVAFFSGSYIILTGATDDLAYVLRQVFRALFLDVEPLEDREFLKHAHDLLWATLILGDEIAHRSGLGRNIPPLAVPGSRVTIPAEQELLGLQRAVTFEDEEIRNLLAPVNLEPAVLDCLSIDDTRLASSLLMQDSALALRPMVRFGTRRVVALPLQLANAALHEVIRLAQARGLMDKVANYFHRAVRSSVRQSLLLMGAHPDSMNVLGREPFPLSSESVFTIDGDKALYILQMSDTLVHFNPNELFGPWALCATPIDAKDALATAAERIYSTRPEINDCLCLLIAQGPAGWMGESYALPCTGTVPGMVLSAAELETIAWAEKGEPLTLWKFTEVAGRLRRRVSITPDSVLDEFAMYRRSRHSDYLPPSWRGGQVAIPKGGGAALRGEVLGRWDFHGSSFLGLPTTVEVFRTSSSGKPIYSLRDTPLPITRSIEALPVPFWIISPMEGDSWDPQMTDIHLLIAEGLAYWVDQLAPVLSPVLRESASSLSTVIIRLILFPASDWANRPAQTNDGTKAVSVVTNAENCTITLSLGSEARALFFRPDNAGERLLLQRVLNGLHDLLPPENRRRVSATEIETWLDQCAPTGPKKAISLLNVSNSPLLDPRETPPYRCVQEGDEYRVLADLGAFVTDELGEPPGVVPADHRDELMKLVIGYLYARLACAVASLSPRGLLERLLVEYEAVVYQQERTRLTMTSRIECSDDPVNEVQSLRDVISEQARTALCSRFLIEYVTAQPPSGLRPVSASVYDELLALCAVLFDWGFAQDLLHYELASPEIVIHPFARVEFKLGEFNEVRQRYYRIFAGHAFERAAEDMIEHWNPRWNDSDDSPFGELQMADTYGRQMSDMLNVIAQVLRIGDDINPSVVGLPLDELVARLRHRLGWDEDRLRRTINDLGLNARSAFIESERQNEVHPWRFHRALSCLRRPLIHRVCNGKVEVLWGSRHLASVIPYLYESFCTQRLKDVDGETQNLMSKAANREGRRFNDEVAELFRRQAQFQVIPRLEKVNGLNNKRVGDIDVLVIDSSHHRVLAVECKQLARAGSPPELKRELDRLFRTENSHIAKHQRHVTWLQEHWERVVDYLKLDNAFEWSIESIMVVDEELFAPHVLESPIPVIAIQELRHRLASQLPVGAVRTD